MGEKMKEIGPTKIHRQFSTYVLMIVDFGRALGTSRVLDARRRGAPTETYKQYAARRSDRRQRGR